jgi:hypothetical protein
VISFRGGPGRGVSDGYSKYRFVGSRESGWLNLHEPGTVRALLDEALASGCQPDDPPIKESDGWLLFEAVAARWSAR